MPERSVVGVAPDFRAEREKAVRLAFGEGRIGEQRGRDRLQRERDPQLLDHVGFGGEVEIGLHRAGPVHHVEAELADLRHVIRHDAIAALRHHRDFGARPFRRHAEAEKADAERARDFAHLREMRHQLGVGLMHGFQRRAGQFELPARLERNRAAAGDVVEADDVVALHDRLPAEQVLHAFEQLARCRAGPHRAPGCCRSMVKGNFSCSVPMRHCDFGLQPFSNQRDEFVAPLDRRHVDLVTGHKAFRQKGPRPYTRPSEGRAMSTGNCCPARKDDCRWG